MIRKVYPLMDLSNTTAPVESVIFDPPLKLLETMSAPIVQLVWLQEMSHLLTDQ